MKKIILACGLLGILGAFSVGCGGNKCEELADAIVGKYESCGVEVKTGDSASGEASCSDAQAKQAECLTPCVEKLDCACIDASKAADCTAEKASAYTDCVAACN